ncbi:HAMP domain-containing sensor histidine kinase [Xylophilus sp. GW821-FHT01B05]
MSILDTELAALGRHLRARREEILKAWRSAVHQDPELTTGTSLPRAQLNDHIPALLASFEARLDPAPGPGPAQRAAEEENQAAAHGLHRWQQGYDLLEVSRELGRLNESVVAELDDYQRDHPEVRHEAMAAARRDWAALCSVGIGESTAQYFRLQQLEAAGHMADLQLALERVQELEKQRGELWHQVAHDLRGNLGVVANVTAGLNRPTIPDPVRSNFVRILDRNASSLRQLLDDVMQLARLQAGKEQRQVAQTDVGTLMREFCEGLQPYAEQQSLFLRFDGPVPLLVQADAVKTRRLAQNLVLNAIKYTRRGGVTVSWRDSPVGDDKRWMLCVQDTGPGLHAGSDAPLAGALEEATELARQSDAAARNGETPHADPGSALQQDGNAMGQEPGEGIGLSIVKRLAELLGASVEVESDAAKGTTFRVLLPKHYPD